RIFGLDQYVWEQMRANLDNWQAQVDEHLVVSLLVYVLVYVAATALSLPAATLVTVVGAALFGRSLGTAGVTAVVSLASTIGATLAFLASRYLLRDWVQARFGNRLAGINRGFERDGGFYLLTLRLVPAFPFFLVNLGMGLTPIRVSTYVLVSWIGMLPGT